MATARTGKQTGQRWSRRLGGVAGAALALAALVGTGMGASGVQAAGPLHLAAQGPTTVVGGAAVRYQWTLSASSGAAGIRLIVDVSNILQPQISVAGAGGFSCQRSKTSDFFETCDGSGMGPGQTATFTVTGQAPLSGTIRAEGHINIGTPPDSVANVVTTIA